MVDVEDFVRGIACLEQAEDILNRGTAGNPPTPATLEQLRGWLEQARGLIDTAKTLLHAG